MRTVSGRVALGVAVAVALAAPARAQTTTRVSVATGGGQALGESLLPSMSADGRYVAFQSTAANLVPGDTNGLQDLFVHDRQTGATERINVGPGGIQADGLSVSPSISANGRFVLFGSTATNLVADDTNGLQDAFVRDRETGTTTRIGPSALRIEGIEDKFFNGAISGDGRYVVFSSGVDTLVAGDTNESVDVFRYDRQTATTIRVSVRTGGAQTAWGHSYASAVNADGRFITFYSFATDLVPGDTNQQGDVFLHDVQLGTTTRVSVGPGGVQGNALSYDGHTSDDGRFTTFATQAINLAPEPHAWSGVFLYDRESGTTSPLAVPPPGSRRGEGGFTPHLSHDGRYVCYAASTFVAIERQESPTIAIFVIDRETRDTRGVGVATTKALVHPASFGCALNADGTVVAYGSDETTLVAGDTNGRADVFVRTLSPAMTVEKTALRFSAVTNGTTFVSQTAAQDVRLTRDGVGTVTWSASSSHPWLLVSPTSGSGSGRVSISVAPAAGLPSSGTVTGTISFALIGSTTTVPPITVTLTLVPTTASMAPFGIVETPTDHRTGVTGAVPITGWTLDDLEVTRVSICRAAFGSESAPIDPNCGGAAEIFVGAGVFIDGARPDVAATYPAYPLATRAGWGFLLLTNTLPNQGNGTYVFRIRAQGREGQWIVLGTRTMTCANASATLPFGTIDTPAQGGTASGSGYVNFGWALTPLPKTINPFGGSIHAFVDGVDLGAVDYGHARSDIQTLFPGYHNTNGAVGFTVLDTTVLADGLHTIAWTVTDDQGATEGLGSRFFSVVNGNASLTAVAAPTRARVDVEALPLETAPIVGRRGWNLDAPYGVFGPASNGVTVVRSEEVSRVELQVGEGEYAGSLRTPAGLAPLPTGSRLDPATNTFVWAPGAGFVGSYDVVFVRSTQGRPVSRREVRILLQPKGRGAVGPQIVLDIPSANAVVAEPFRLGGWAVDLDASTGTGVTTVHAWAFPASGGKPVFLGAATYGGARPDVAAVHGAQFTDSGFGLVVQGLPPGAYDLALFAWSTETMGFVAPKIVRLSVAP